MHVYSYYWVALVTSNLLVVASLPVSFITIE